MPAKAWVVMSSLTSVVRLPVDLPVQCGLTALAMLLESQIDCHQNIAVVSHIVNDEPTGERVAAAVFAGPGKSALHRIVEREASQVRVVTDLEAAKDVHGLERAVPILITIDGNGQPSAFSVCRE